MFIWRPLTRREYYMFVMRSNKGEDVAADVCSLAVLYPEGIDYNTMPGGVTTRLADDIWRMSAMPSRDKLVSQLDSYRSLMSSFERQAECVIAAVFPAIRIEEMREWPLQKLLDYAVRAEWILNNLHMVPVRFDKITEGEEENQNASPEKLRSLGIDPMMTLDASKLRPQFLPERLFAGVSAWKEPESIKLQGGKEDSGKGGAAP